MDTIFAVASGLPPAAIAVIRISGPQALAAVVALAGALPEPRQASLRALRDPQGRALLDRALILCFPGPASATGEDCAEFHVHGGRAVVAAVAAALGTLPGVRPAQAGEFTRRALLNGRIDLAQAEGLGDLLMAETEAQRRSAMANVDGAVGRAIGDWSAQLVAASALVEAQLDFSDEADIGNDAAPAIAEMLTTLAAALRATLATAPVERLRDGLHIVLGGPPNSGKSTLLNRLCERDAAIVSDIAGTTRDRIEVPLVRRGIAYVLTDTAGLADSAQDPVEATGMARARVALAAADIILWLGDDPPPWPNAIWLWPRCDIRPTGDQTGRLAVSGSTGAGLAALWLAIEAHAARMLPRADQLALNQRQRALCGDCLDEVTAALAATDPLLVAEHVRRARGALDSVTGVTDTEAMLDALFGRFCIGK